MLEDELMTFNVRRLQLPATRVTSTSATSIDLICTNIHDVQFTVFETGLSDHSAQTCSISLAAQNKRQVICENRNFSNESLISFGELLSNEDWQSVYNKKEADAAYKEFLGTVRRAMDCACPKKKRKMKTKAKPKSFSDNYAKELKAMHLAALHKFQITGAAEDKNTMNSIKKQYDLRLRTLQLTSTSEMVSRASNRPRALWSIINSERKGSRFDTSTPTISIEGVPQNDPHKTADHFNHIFSQMADKTLKPNQHHMNSIPISTDHTFKFKPVTPETVRKVISSLKPKLSCGLDEVPAKLVKHSTQLLSAPLAHIFNRSIIQGKFPSLLKVAKIFPKHKKGPTSDAENYRPISNISTFAKVFEKIVLAQLMEHLNQYGLLTESQHGFLRGKSTITALIDFIEHVIDQLENRKYISATLLDYSKAFDCIGHNQVVNKLEALGVRDVEKAWFSDYLTGRAQVVEVQQDINGRKTFVHSSPLPIRRGVPQGSVLGPVLFILLTNDFSSIFHQHHNIKCIMYADDTSILISNDSAQGLAADTINALNQVVKYSRNNDLAINPSKTVHINFSRRHEELPDIIDLKPETKLLGVTIDSDLSWTTHTNNLCKKLSTGAYVVRRMKWIGGLSTAKTAYFALMESHIRYGLAVWGSTSEENLTRVLILQKRAIRTLADLNFRDSCREAFKTLGIMTVVALYIQAVILFADGEKFPRSEAIHSYKTRQADMYYLPTHRTTQLEKKPSYIGRKLCNALPKNIRTLTEVNLKRTLHKWLIGRPLYSLKEFFEAAKKEN